MASAQVLGAFRAQAPRLSPHPEVLAVYMPRREKLGKETSFRTSELRSWKNPQVLFSDSDSWMWKTYLEVLAQDLEVVDKNFELLRELCLKFRAETLIGRRQYGFMMVFPGSTEGREMAERCYRSICPSPILNSSLRRRLNHGNASESEGSSSLTVNGISDSPCQLHQLQGAKNCLVNGNEKEDAGSLDKWGSPKQTLTVANVGINTYTQTMLGFTPTFNGINRINNAIEAKDDVTGANTKGASPWHVNRVDLNSHMDPDPSNTSFFTPANMSTEDNPPKEPSPMLTAQGNRTLARLHLQRRSSGGSDDMSISSGQTASEVPSLSSSRATPRCCSCKGSDTTNHNPLIKCGCRRYYHAACHKPAVLPQEQKADTTWTCSLCLKRTKKQSSAMDSHFSRSPTPRDHLRQLHVGRSKNRQYQHSPYTQSPLTFPTSAAGEDAREVLSNTSPVNTMQEENHRKATLIDSEVLQESCTPSASIDKPCPEHSSHEEFQYDGDITVERGPRSGDVLVHIGNGSAADHKTPDSASKLGDSPGLFGDRFSSPLSILEAHRGMSSVTQAVAPAGLLDQNLFHSPKSSTSPRLSLTHSNDAMSPELGLPTFSANYIAFPGGDDFMDSNPSFLFNIEPSDLTGRPGETDASSKDGTQQDLTPFHFESESDLSSLPDEEPPHPDPRRPKESYNDMIRNAIEASAEGRLDGRAIVEIIRAKYRYYRETENQKRLYSNVHALLSMGKKDGKYVKHDPNMDSPNGPRARCTYSVGKAFIPRAMTGERSTTVVEKAGYLHVPETRSNRSSAARRLASASPSPSTHSRQYDQEQEMRSLPLGDVGYRVRNHSSLAYRIVPKNGLPEWESLPILSEYDDSEDIFAIGDMVKILTDSPDDEFGLIFDMREVSEERIAVAVLWYRSHKDLTQVLSHKNRREWPEGYKYMLSNEVDVISLKAIECKADTRERATVFPGTKVWDCSGRPHLIRECTAKEVAWVFALTGSKSIAMAGNGSKIKSSKVGNGRAKFRPCEQVKDSSELGLVDHTQMTKSHKSVLRKRKRTESTPLIKADDDANNFDEITNGGSGVLSSNIESDQSLELSPASKGDSNLVKKRKTVSPPKLDLEFSRSHMPHSTNTIFAKRTTQRAPSETSSAINTLYQAGNFGHALTLLSATHTGVDTAEPDQQSKLQLQEENTMLRTMICDLLTRKEMEHLHARPRHSANDGDHIDDSTPQLQQEGARVANMQRNQVNHEQAYRHDTTAEQVTGDELVIGVQRLLAQLRSESQKLCMVPERLRTESLDRDLEIRLLQRIQRQQKVEIQVLSDAVGNSTQDASRLRAVIERGTQQQNNNYLVPSQLLYDLKLASLDDTENKHRSSLQPIPVASNTANLKSQKKRMFGKHLPRPERTLFKYGETPCSELRALLNIPEGHVICSYQGRLAYRNDARKSDGSLLHPNAVFPLDGSQTMARSDGND